MIGVVNIFGSLILLFNVKRLILYRLDKYYFYNLYINTPRLDTGTRPIFTIQG